METIELAKQAATAAHEKKAFRIALIDMREHSDLCEFMLMCSGSNDRQTKAVADAIEEVLAKKFTARPLAIEGKQSGHWVLIDYGAFIVHIFLDNVRDYYALEKLWPDAPHVQLNLL